MKKELLTAILLLLPGMASAQMPSSFDASGKSAQAANGVENNDPNSVGETPNPQLFGMELPLLDPSNDSVKYGGGKFDVGNNALVRARFEKYLSQNPDERAEAKKYRKIMRELLSLTRKYTKDRQKIGSKVLVKVGKALYAAAEFDMDNGQCDALGNAIISALETQRGNRDLEEENQRMDEEIERMMKQNNIIENRNAHTRSIKSNAGKGKTGGGSDASERNTVKLADNTKKVATNTAAQVKNDATRAANLLAAKTQYQAMMVHMFIQRYYDHAVIAARLYRHIFRDGDSKLQIKEDSDASKTFVGVTGMPPTVATVDSLASTAAGDVDKSMESVRNLIAQNKMGAATQRLIEAVAVGEFMESVCTFPMESRNKVAKFWSLRKRALTAMNGRDYGGVLDIAKQMREMDIDFDDAQLKAYCSAKMKQSNMELASAQQAAEKGDMDAAKQHAQNAAIVWPLNPRLDQFQGAVEEVVNKAPLRDEFRKLYEAKEYRRIAADQARFAPVAMDPELKEKYMEAIRRVETIEGTLTQVAEMSRTDRTMGPCIAYEALRRIMREHPEYADDVPLDKALRHYETEAHDFVKLLRDAENFEQEREFGSALSSYLRARVIYPNSYMAKDGIRRVSDVIASATYQ